MTQTYWQIKEKIAALEAQAEELKRSERADAIAKTRATIEAFGLTAKDLFGAKPAKVPDKGAAKRAAVKFADGKGNVWGGRGPRPQWVRAALASGAQLNDLLAGGAPAAEAKSATADLQPLSSAVPTQTKVKSNSKAKRNGAVAKPAAKQKVAAKYRDEEGNTWSGRGLQPHWLRAARSWRTSRSDPVGEPVHSLCSARGAFAVGRARDSRLLSGLCLSSGMWA